MAGGKLRRVDVYRHWRAEMDIREALRMEIPQNV